MMSDVLAQLGSLGVIPVITIQDVANAEPLAQALRAGGLPCAEITFRTPAAEAAIQSIASSFPEMFVGAGTVLTVSQAEAAVAAGAKFIVTPGFDAVVVDWCLGQGIPIIPGVMTPTEINMGLNKGLSLLKFFPAETAGGISALKAICAPYVGIRFIPTGGITSANLPDYLRLPAVHACGGSWIATDQMISSGEFGRIQQLAVEAVEIVKQARKG
jgi:2-dehydro-3-deoxyphosphogluconate aldolase/(4S)-4-hydroxy-2-oxoglutarate aldolase